MTWRMGGTLLPRVHARMARSALTPDAGKPHSAAAGARENSLQGEAALRVWQGKVAECADTWMGGQQRLGEYFPCR